MRVTIEIEGDQGCGKTQLAQFIENKLREEYSVEFIRMKTSIPLTQKEVYSYNVAPF